MYSENYMFQTQSKVKVTFNIFNLRVAIMCMPNNHPILK